MRVERQSVASEDGNFMDTLTKRIGIALVLALGILSAGVASATVTYQWQEVSTPPDFTPSGGTITIDDAAWHNGSLDFYESVPEGMPPGPGGYFPDSPIIQLSAFFAGIAPRDYLQIGLPWTLLANLEFDQQTGFMSGDLSFYTFSTDLSMSSGVGDLWTINYYETDADMGGPCGSGPPVCSGATGRWVLHSVPEPSALPLFALGLILIMGLGLTRRFSSASRHVSRTV